jgi:TatD DNase family protein
MLIDTHMHIDPAASADAVAGMIDRARAAGVTGMVAVGGEPGSNAAALSAAATHAGTVWAAIGLDRHMADKDPDMAAMARQVAAAPAGRVVAIGETGLDGHYATPSLPEQARLMVAHLELARALRLPAVIHTRDADDATYDLLAAHAREWSGDPGRIGVIHCYTGGADFAARLIGLGFMIGLSGILTFRNAAPLREVARRLPADRLLVETDTPYLAPIPHRGKVNEPAWVRLVAEQLAALRGMPLPDLARLTTANAGRLFGVTVARDA